MLRGESYNLVSLKLLFNDYCSKSSIRLILNLNYAFSFSLNIKYNTSILVNLIVLYYYYQWYFSISLGLKNDTYIESILEKKPTKIYFRGYYNIYLLIFLSNYTKLINYNKDKL